MKKETKFILRKEFLILKEEAEVSLQFYIILMVQKINFILLERVLSMYLIILYLITYIFVPYNLISKYDGSVPTEGPCVGCLAIPYKYKKKTELFCSISVFFCVKFFVIFNFLFFKFFIFSFFSLLFFENSIKYFCLFQYL